MTNSIPVVAPEIFRPAAGATASISSVRLSLLCSLCCLDAPAVAVSWLLLFANCFYSTVAVANIAALFLTVWLIYLVDRFVDSLSLEPGLSRSARQRFCSRNRTLWVSLIALAGLGDAAIVCFILDRTVLIRGVFVGALVVAYLVVNWSCSKVWTAVPLKEIIIGLLFSAGTLLATGCGVLPVSIVPAGALFAALCFVNCVSIAFWERQLDRSQGKHSIATRFGTWSQCGNLLTATLLIGCAFLLITNSQLWPVAVCIALSAIALNALDSSPMCRDARTALADLVLLTPMIFLAMRKVL